MVLLVERGVRVKGFFEGREYVSFDRENPVDAIKAMVSCLEKLKGDKEFAQAAVAIGAIVGLLVLLIIILAFAGKK